MLLFITYLVYVLSQAKTVSVHHMYLHMYMYIEAW